MHIAVHKLDTECRHLVVVAHTLGDRYWSSVRLVLIFSVAWQYSVFQLLPLSALTYSSTGLIPYYFSLTFRLSLKIFFLAFGEHLNNMTNPSQLSLNHNSHNVSIAGTLKNIDIQYLISPWQSEISLKTADVKCFKISYVSYISCILTKKNSERD